MGIASRWAWGGNKGSDARSTYPQLTCKVDIMDILLEPRVGDMRDFFDEMSLKEIAQWKTRYVVDCVTKIYPDYL